MTENNDINPELQKAVQDLAQNMDRTEAENRRPFLEKRGSANTQGLTKRQKLEKTAKRKAVKAARRINRRK